MSGSETTTGWGSPGTPPAGLADRDLSGLLLGGEFLVERLIGRGGMGEVYLARQQGLDRPVALKVLRPELTSNPTFLGRFEVEASAAARLNHPNVVQVYTLGRHDDLRFLAMEYVRGTNRRDYLDRKGTVDLPLASSIMRQACQAMAAAADLGLIHRDLKPENLLLTREGRVKVADFGLCRDQGAAAPHLTQEGVTLGTPMYMSPEQVRGRSLDHRSDLYSLGVTFYQMLAGIPPFRAETALAVALQHLQDPPIDLAVHRPDLPPALSRLVMRMLAKDPEDRPASAREVERELLTVQGLSTPTRAHGEVTIPSLAETEVGDGVDAGGRDEGSGPWATEAHEAPRSRQPSGRPSRSRMLRPAPLATIGLVGGLVGALIGWSSRPPDLLAGGPPAGPPGLWLAPSWEEVPRQASARDQLRYAQLRAGPAERPAALLAVAGHFPGAEAVGTAAYIQLARTYLDRLDRRGLRSLADSLDDDPGSEARRRRLAGICRAGAEALDDRPDATLEYLTAGTTAPSYLDPPLAELAMEVAEWARNSPAAASQSIQWANVRDDLLQALRVVTFDPAERFEPGRRRPPSRP